MNRRLLSLALLLLCSVAGAQNRFSCNFELFDTSSGKDKSLMKGVAYVQDLCYRVETEDGYVRGNGTDRWIYYAKTLELVIQKDDSSIFSKITLTKAGEGSATVKYADYKAVLSSIKVTEEQPESFFSVSTSSISKDVIITDLRD